MIEKVNPMHPDKVADRIAGAIVDLAYAKEDNPRIAVEVLIGHGVCHAIIETSTILDEKDISDAIFRIAGDVQTDIVIVPQDEPLSDNQKGAIRCGDNGIFKGMPLTEEQKNYLNSQAEFMMCIQRMESIFLMVTDLSSARVMQIQRN